MIKTIYFHSNQARAAAAAQGIALPGRTAPINIYGPGASTLPAATPGVYYPNGLLVYPATADYVDEHFSVQKGGVERYLQAFVAGISDDNGPPPCRVKVRAPLPIPLTTCRRPCPAPRSKPC